MHRQSSKKNRPPRRRSVESPPESPEREVPIEDERDAERTDVMTPHPDDETPEGPIEESNGRDASRERGIE